MSESRIEGNSTDVLNKWIKSVVVGGKRANYDRTGVLSTAHSNISFSNSTGADDGTFDRATVTVPSFEAIAADASKDEKENFGGGTCRELAQWAAHRLVKENIVKSAEVYACATEKEAHYVVIVTNEDGEKLLVDIGYSQPVLQAIPIDGGIIESNEYAGAPGSKQAFKGAISYYASKNPDSGEITFIISTDENSTRFDLNKLTPELDAKVVKMWARATGSGYSTKVMPNEDGTFRVDAGLMGSEATLRKEFKSVHELVGKFGTDAVNVVFR